MNTAAGVAGLVLMGIAGAVSADSWTRTGDVGRNPVAKTTQEEYAFSSTGRVEVRGIGGSVLVKTGASELAAWLLAADRKRLFDKPMEFRKAGP